MYIRYDNDFDRRETDTIGIWWVCSDDGRDLRGFDTEEEAEEALETFNNYYNEATQAIADVVAAAAEYFGNNDFDVLII